MKLQFILFFLLLTKSTLFFSQDTFDLSVHHDTKFFFIGDDRGNHAGTLDLLVKVEIPIVKFLKSYIVVYPLLEHVNLHTGALKRYALGFGYIRENLFLKKLNAGVFPNFGAINRFGTTTTSFGIDFEISYQLFKRLSISYIHQIVERTDLKHKYNESSFIRPSSFLGFKVHF